MSENASAAFQGPVQVGPFDIEGKLARDWLRQSNPDNRSNSDVVRPWANGQNLARRSGDTWIVDFGSDRLEADAAL